jgi:excisionase family DNA binding protein
MQQLSETRSEATTADVHAIDAADSFTTHEVAKLCGVCSSSVARWTMEHGLACYRTPGGHRRIVARDLAEFMRAWGMPLPFSLAG